MGLFYALNTFALGLWKSRLVHFSTEFLHQPAAMWNAKSEVMVCFLGKPPSTKTTVFYEVWKGPSDGQLQNAPYCMVLPSLLDKYSPLPYTVQCTEYMGRKGPEQNINPFLNQCNNWRACKIGD